MKISGVQAVPVDPKRAYEALQDPVLLAKSMPGCDRLERAGEDVYDMKMKMLLASISGQFEGRVQIAEKNPPESFKLIVEGHGKIGFVKGEGLLRIHQNGAGTEVAYDGDVQVGGTIASVGQRLIDTTAKMMIKKFFQKLISELQTS